MPHVCEPLNELINHEVYHELHIIQQTVYNKNESLNITNFSKVTDIVNGWTASGVIIAVTIFDCVKKSL